MKRFILLVAASTAFNFAAARTRPIRKPAASQVQDSFALTKILTIQEARADRERYLEVALRHPSKSVVRAALLAMARIVDPSFVEPLAGVLNRKDRQTARGLCAGTNRRGIFWKTSYAAPGIADR